MFLDQIANAQRIEKVHKKRVIGNIVIYSFMVKNIIIVYM